MFSRIKRFYPYTVELKTQGAYEYISITKHKEPNKEVVVSPPVYENITAVFNFMTQEDVIKSWESAT